MVCASYDELPSAENDTLVLPFLIGPWLLTCTRLVCSGGRVEAKALRAFSEVSRKPKVTRLRQSI